MNTLKELLHKVSPVEMYFDNQGAVKICNTSSSVGRTRHVEVKLHFITKDVKENLVGVFHLPGANNVADVFTKP